MAPGPSAWPASLTHPHSLALLPLSPLLLFLPMADFSKKLVKELRDTETGAGMMKLQEGAPGKPNGDIDQATECCRQKGSPPAEKKGVAPLLKVSIASYNPPPVPGWRAFWKLKLRKPIFVAAVMSSKGSAAQRGDADRPPAPASNYVSTPIRFPAGDP